MHYVIGDIHGQIDALKILLDKLNLQEEDKVYFVGDWFDREYGEEDKVETVKWMLENLTDGSRFVSVLGNHDLSMLQTIQDILSGKNKEEDFYDLFSFFEPEYIRMHYGELCELLQKMPLYESIVTEGKEFLVTHSWIVDNNGKAIGMKDFDITNISRMDSIWDRAYSEEDYEKDEEIPIIIHGHTPTISNRKMEDGKCYALSKIKKIGSKNINIDCCAFYSPMRGGNLAAYRCEDGAEFYAYEDELFYSLVDQCCNELSFTQCGGISRYDWYFAFLFYGCYIEALGRDADSLTFTNSRAKETYDRMRSLYNPEEDKLAYLEAERHFKYVKKRIHEIVPSYWKRNRRKTE